MESVLLEFDANLKKDRDIEKVKKDVKLLKRKRHALQERENKVTGDINTGQVREARSYRLPLSVLPQPGGQRSQPQLQRLRSVADLKQRLAASGLLAPPQRPHLGAVQETCDQGWSRGSRRTAWRPCWRTPTGT